VGLADVRHETRATFSSVHEQLANIRHADHQQSQRSATSTLKAAVPQTHPQID
jgi:hypothetical protein